MALPILAIDPATRLGWALGLPCQQPMLGTVLLTGKGHPARFRAVEEWLGEMADAHGGFAEVVVEAPAPSGNFSSQSAARILLGFAITIETWCWDNGVPHREIYVGQARKLLLGRGSFKKGEAKPAVMRWARERGFPESTHDAADAALLLAYALMVPRS